MTSTSALQLDAANWALVALTFVLVVVTAYYAFQNARMVREMRRQNRPYVFIVFDQEDDSRYTLFLRNAGSRSAHGVEVTIVQDGTILATPATGAIGTPRPTQRVKVSGQLRNPHFLPPGDQWEIGFVERFIGTTHSRRTLLYSIRYNDGAGAEYGENDMSADYFEPSDREPTPPVIAKVEKTP